MNMNKKKMTTFPKNSPKKSRISKKNCTLKNLEIRTNIKNIEIRLTIPKVRKISGFGQNKIENSKKNVILKISKFDF